MEEQVQKQSVSKRLNSIILRKIYFRSFLLQSVWNYERMQNVGFLFSILPKLKSLYGKDKDKLKESCKRYIGFSNTHPYMVSFLLGFAAKQEEKINKGDGETEEVLERFKLQMAGPLAATGDKLFWSTWRPLVGLIGVFLVLLNIRPYYLVPLTFILLYNIPVLMYRHKFLQVAYEDESEITETIRKLHGNFILNSFPVIGLLIVTGCLITAFIHLGWIKGGLFMGVVVVVTILRKSYPLSATKLLYIISALIIAGNLVIKLF